MKSNLNIIIVDQELNGAKDLAKRAGLLDHGVCEFRTHDCSLEQLATLSPDLVILGPSLESINCLKFIHKIKIVDPAIPILVTSHSLHSGDLFCSPVEGVYYLDPETDRDSVPLTIEQALKNNAECEFWREMPLIVGQSSAIKDVRERVRKVSDKDITLLITGETGTGKELIARSIHYHSIRRKGPLVKVNCTSLPDDLLESEVFGFQKGAFTDAHRDKPGRIELANGGTLFIDEIGDLSLSLQVKFLQVLEDKAFSRLGGTDDKFVDARVVAATNSDLWKKVQEGSFRKDLFYRLNVVHLRVPPLRNRKDDILLLTHYFINKYCFEFKKELLDLPEGVIEFFMTYRWPGNIRELENVVRRAIALRDWNFVFNEFNLESVSPEELSDNEDCMDIEWNESKLGHFLKEHDFSLKKVCKVYVSDAERKAILRALNETQWNRTKSAELLQVSYKTLLNRIDEFNLKPSRSEDSGQI
jgi:two-component system response regulator AtoC